jgi:cell division protein FtsW (lipid II flippase)
MQITFIIIIATIKKCNQKKNIENNRTFFRRKNFLCIIYTTVIVIAIYSDDIHIFRNDHQNMYTTFALCTLSIMIMVIIFIDTVTMQLPYR